jgi:hypothetical protein
MIKAISSKMVLHFFVVSYIWEPTQHWNAVKAERRDQLLEAYCSREDK